MKNKGCANCGQPRVNESTLCANCLPDGFLRATGKTARVTEKKESLINTLKKTNKEKQIIIDDFIWHGFEQNRKILLLKNQVKELTEMKHREGIEKDNKIAELKQQVEEAYFVIRDLAQK